MKTAIWRGISALGLISLWFLPGALDKQSISIGQAVMLSAVCLGTMYIGAKQGGLMEKEKSPARQQPCKATYKNIQIKYNR